MLSLLRLEGKPKIIQIHSEFACLFLSYSFGIETINTFMHWSVFPSKTIPDSRPKCAKCLPVFRQKRRKNPTRWDGTYLYSLYTTASALPIFEPQVEKFNLRKQFIWDEVSKGKFIGLLKQDDFLLRLCQFETTSYW